MNTLIKSSLALSLLLSITVLSGCNTMNSDKNVLLPIKEDPTISFRIWFKTGSQFDPAGKEGLATLTAALITDGATQTNSYEKILEKLYPLAASYSASVDKEMTVVSGRTHKDNIEAYYALLTDALLKPAFKEEDFQRIKSNMLNEIEKTLRYSSDEDLGKAALYDFIYRGTKYGHLNNGTVAGLQSITLEDVRSFYTKYYTKDNYVIGMGGGYEDVLLKRLQGDLDKLPEGKVEQPPRPVPEKIEGFQMQIVEKECGATAISFGFPIDVLRGQGDFFALALFNSWFGEHRNSSSHLYQVIRELRGMNYGDYSYIEVFPNGGQRHLPAPNYARRQQLFEVWLRPVQNHQRHFALRAALRELKNVIDNGMTQEQFDLTKKFLRKYALHYASTTSERLGYAIDSKFYGIENDYIDLFIYHIDQLTLAKVNETIKRHLQYKNIKIAVVTNNAGKFKADLVSNAPSPITYETPKPETVLKVDKEIEIFPLDIKPENITIVPVEQMFAK